MSEPLWKRQPILVGCLGCLGLAVVGACAFGLATYLGLSALWSGVNDAVGLKNLISANMELAEKGYSLGTMNDNGDIYFTLETNELKETSCEDVETLLFPHLSGSLETVRVEVKTWKAVEGGPAVPETLTCTWSGYPGRAPQ